MFRVTRQLDPNTHGWDSNLPGSFQDTLPVFKSCPLQFLIRILKLHEVQPMRKRKGLWESGDCGAERAVKTQCLWKGGTTDGDKERRKGQDEGRGRDELGHL